MNHSTKSLKNTICIFMSQVLECEETNFRNYITFDKLLPCLLVTTILNLYLLVHFASIEQTKWKQNIFFSPVTFSQFLFWRLPIPVHTILAKFENAELFQRLGLPSTLIRHEFGAFRKLSLNRTNSKTPPLRFSTEGNRDVIFLSECSSNTNPQWPVVLSFQISPA